MTRRLTELIITAELRNTRGIQMGGEVEHTELCSSRLPPSELHKRENISSLQRKNTMCNLPDRTDFTDLTADLQLWTECSQRVSGAQGNH